jgi:hypothetical protein
MQHDKNTLFRGLGQGILDACKGVHQEAVAQAIVHAISSPRSTFLDEIYLLALEHLSGGKHCSTLVPLLTGKLPVVAY